jgi:NitT/TauT family transport system substrate-binding protein
MTTKWFGIFVALLLAPAMVGPNRAQAEPAKIVDVLGPDAFYYMLHYIADGAGLFTAEGIAVDLVTVNSGSRQVATVMGGSAELAEVNLSVVVQGQVQGADMMNIGAVYRIFPHVLLLGNDALKKTGIVEGMPIDEKVKRLHGLKIGITSPGSGTDQLMRALFIGRGLDPDKEVTLLPLGGGPPMMAALKQKAVDGFVFTAPLPQAATAEGLGQVVISPFIGEVPEMRGLTYMALVASRDALTNKRPQLLSLVRGLTKARKFAQDKPDEARRITRAHFLEMDEKIYNASFDEALKGLPDTLEITPPELEKTLAFMNLLNKKEQVSAKYEEVIDSSLARQAAKEILGR